MRGCNASDQGWEAEREVVDGGDSCDQPGPVVRGSPCHDHAIGANVARPKAQAGHHGTQQQQRGRSGRDRGDRHHSGGVRPVLAGARGRGVVRRTGVAGGSRGLGRHRARRRAAGSAPSRESGAAVETSARTRTCPRFDDSSASWRRYNAGVSTATTLRSHAEVSAFFAGTEVLAPGVVQLHRWHPDEPARPQARSPPTSASAASRNPRALARSDHVEYEPVRKIKISYSERVVVSP
jgi:hypothetical protein